MKIYQHMPPETASDALVYLPQHALTIKPPPELGLPAELPVLAVTDAPCVCCTETHTHVDLGLCKACLCTAQDQIFWYR